MFNKTSTMFFVRITIKKIIMQIIILNLQNKKTRSNFKKFCVFGCKPKKFIIYFLYLVLGLIVKKIKKKLKFSLILVIYK